MFVQTSQPIHVVWCDRHLHTSYVECVSGVPPPLSQGTKESLLGKISRLCLHEVFEASCFHKGTGQRIKPCPPFKNLNRVASRHKGVKRLHKRKRHESVRNKPEGSIEVQKIEKIQRK